MAKNITYLVGAGASFGTLPLVKDLPTGLREFAKTIEGLSPSSEMKRLIKDTVELAGAADGQTSIDTLAKQYYTSGNDNNLRRLKAVLSIYLNWQQVSRPINKRYDLFYASLYDKAHACMPKNIQIVSWNYDIQFEKSFNNYVGLNDIGKLRTKLGIVHKGEVFDNAQKFRVFKVNGTASLCPDGRDEIPFYFFSTTDDERKMLCAISELYVKAVDSPDMKSGLSFAWEGDEWSKKLIASLKNTQILVVIGYSFPDFNRLLDASLLSAMASTLQRIFIQDTPSAYLTIKRKIEDILQGRTTQGLKFDDTPDYENSFYIPHEWFQGALHQSPY